MNIGILSDTHDNLPRVRAAVDMFNTAGVGFVIHAGDIVAPFTVVELVKLSCDWTGVFGNNDGEHAGLFRASGGRIHEPPVRLSLDGVGITVVHDLSLIDPAAEKSTIIVHGHSHKALVSRNGGRLMVNPGECGGWVTGQSTIAFCDTARLTATIVKL